MELDALCRLILETYRAARELPEEEFPDFALGLVKSLLPFDSARWVIVRPVGSGAMVLGSHLHNEPLETVLEWAEINHRDVITAAVVANPSRALSSHAPTLYAAPDAAAVRDYAVRAGHLNALVIADHDPTPGHMHGISLYRADRDEHFAAADRSLVEQIMPHLVEARAVNQTLAIRKGEAGSGDRSIAGIARANGLLHHCGDAFAQLLREEWSEWNGVRLPDALLSALAQGGAGFVGARITVSARQIGELLFLRARRNSALNELSPRETSVARLYGEGKSYKEIARQLAIEPVTVRNFLQRVFRKLRINDKAELVALLIRAER